MTDQDLTSHSIQSFDLLDLPIGIYMVTSDGRFVICNRLVRRMLDLPPEGPVSANIADFYAKREERQKILQKVHEADQRGKYLERETLHFRVRGRDLFVENFCRPVRDPQTQEITAYVGCLVDITSDQQSLRKSEELRARVDELATDIGQTLHANTTTLIMVHQTLDSVIETLEPNPFETELPTTEEIDRELAEQARSLIGSIERFQQAVPSARRLDILPEAKWNLLAGRVTFLHEYKEKVPETAMRFPALRFCAHEIAHLSREVAPGILPREAARDLQQAAWQMERLCTLIDVLNTRVAAVQMDHTLHALREFVTSDKRETEKRTRQSAKYLVEQTISRLAEFARSSNVEIRVEDITTVDVEVNEREVVRALANLLHNAIKYTWKRQQSRSSWVTIRTHLRERLVSFEFENWGVPITRDELAEGKIFELGYRGELATDRGRLGTGIGLTDARRVARAQGGELQLSSRPSWQGLREDDPEYYKHPFITTATFTIPVAGETKSS